MADWEEIIVDPGVALRLATEGGDALLTESRMNLILERAHAVWFDVAKAATVWEPVPCD